MWVIHFYKLQGTSPFLKPDIHVICNLNFLLLLISKFVTIYTKTTHIKVFLSKCDVSTLTCTSQLRPRPFELSVTARSNLSPSVSSSTWRTENHVKRANLKAELNNKMKCATTQIWNFKEVRPCLEFNSRIQYNFVTWFITRSCLLVEHYLRICIALQIRR